MGFEPPENAYKLTFADDPYTGLEVTVRGFSMGKVLENRALSASGARDATQDELARLMDMLIENIDGWNVEKKGVPLEPTRENILAQDPKMLMAVVNEWTAAVTGVSAPLDGGSTSGADTPELSLPMEPVSPNPQN